VTDAARPDPRRLPLAPTTRFAPAPTGLLHLGHLANALYVWGVARATGGRVVLRIEDHDRQRSRAAYEGALLADLDALGLAPDEPSLASLRAGPSSYRQSDGDAVYADALAELRRQGLIYACTCSRATYERFATEQGRAWSGPGCPGGCRERGLRAEPDRGLRVALGTGREAWDDLLGGPMGGDPVVTGDPLVRDPLGNWTYGFCVVVDDRRQAIDLVIRGRDLVDATPAQLRLARRLGRETPPAFLHHPLIRKPGGAKLSKANGDTSIRSMLADGVTPADLFGRAAAAVGLLDVARPLRVEDVGSLFR
jgi:glutamyl-Q tRNA(Asp) synthetase